MNERAVAVVDAGFGDAGKGLVTDFLARSLQARLVVRFNGGAQAGHNVVTPDGRHHTFSQIGAGSFVPGVRTHLSRRVIVHPTALLVEAERLAAKGVDDALSRLTVSDAALVVTPFHQAACRVRELARGGGRHGSCGVGVGEVMRDALAHPDSPLRAKDLAAPSALRPRLARIQERLRASLADLRSGAPPEALAELRVLEDSGFLDAWIDATRPFAARARVSGDEVVRDALRAGERVIFEGAQGVLLDEDWGFHPHTTWSRCTFANADELLHDVGEPTRAYRLAVARVFAHRHGPGPLPTESAIGAAWEEPHNVDGPWQGPFRVGWPDLVMARYARRISEGFDALALTHLDRLPARGAWRVAASYDGGASTEWPVTPPHDLELREESTRRLGRVEPDYVEVDAGDVVDALAEAYGAPVRLASRGPTAEDARWA
jgi:adenylosuccinate synthase